MVDRNRNEQKISGTNQGRRFSLSASYGEKWVMERRHRPENKKDPPHQLGILPIGSRKSVYATYATHWRRLWNPCGIAFLALSAF